MKQSPHQPLSHIKRTVIVQKVSYKKKQYQSYEQRIKTLQQEIRLHQANIKQLLAFASGEKKLSVEHPGYAAAARIPLKDRMKCLAWTLTNLREQMTEMQKEVALLKRITHD
jgi:hypothetical protein